MGRIQVGTLLVFGAAYCAVMPTAGSAQRGPRKAAPEGREIAEKATLAKLDATRVSSQQVGGRKVVLSPAAPAQAETTMEDIEAGQIIGVLDTEAPGDETGLPPGKYDLFAAKVGDTWHVYAEAGGRIVREAARVRLRMSDKPGDRKPEFHAKGYGYTILFCMQRTSLGGCIYWEKHFVDFSASPTSIGILVGGSTQLHYTLLVDGTPVSIGATWSSSKPAVATVSASGVAQGVAQGVDTVMVEVFYIEHEFRATSVVTVSNAPSAPPGPLYPALDFYW